MGWFTSVEVVTGTISNGASSATVNLTQGQTAANCYPDVSTVSGCATDTEGFAQLMLDVEVLAGPARIVVTRGSTVGDLDFAIPVIEVDPMQVRVQVLTVTAMDWAGTTCELNCPATPTAGSTFVIAHLQKSTDAYDAENSLVAYGPNIDGFDVKLYRGADNGDTPPVGHVYVVDDLGAGAVFTVTSDAAPTSWAGAQYQREISDVFPFYVPTTFSILSWYATGAGRAPADVGVRCSLSSENINVFTAASTRDRAAVAPTIDVSTILQYVYFQDGDTFVTHGACYLRPAPTQTNTIAVAGAIVATSAWPRLSNTFSVLCATATDDISQMCCTLTFPTSKTLRATNDSTTVYPARIWATAEMVWSAAGGSALDYPTRSGPPYWALSVETVSDTLLNGQTTLTIPLTKGQYAPWCWPDTPLLANVATETKNFSQFMLDVELLDETPAKLRVTRSEGLGDLDFSIPVIEVDPSWGSVVVATPTWTAADTATLTGAPAWTSPEWANNGILFQAHLKKPYDMAQTASECTVGLYYDFSKLVRAVSPMDPITAPPTGHIYFVERMVQGVPWAWNTMLVLGLDTLETTRTFTLPFADVDVAATSASCQYTVSDYAAADPSLICARVSFAAPAPNTVSVTAERSTAGVVLAMSWPDTLGFLGYCYVWTSTQFDILHADIDGSFLSTTPTDTTAIPAVDLDASWVHFAHPYSVLSDSTNITQSTAKLDITNTTQLDGSNASADTYSVLSASWQIFYGSFPTPPTPPPSNRRGTFILFRCLPIRSRVETVVDTPEIPV